MSKYFDYPESSLQNEMIYDDKLEQYTKAFDIDQKAEINLFFQEYGFVIIKNVLPIDECYKTEKEIMSLMKFDKKKPSTYKKWPSFGKESEGIVCRKPLFTCQTVNNRQNERIYSMFSRLLNSTDLQVSHDSCYFLRPTKHIKFEDNQIKTMEEWKTKKVVRLDVDIDKCYAKPEELADKLKNLSYVNLINFICETCIFSFSVTPLNVEGLINLTNNKKSDGGFSCVPGFHKYFTEWYKHNQKNKKKKNTNSYISNLKPHLDDTKYKKYIFDENDPIKDKLVKINMKAGWLLIWDQRLPYCIEPNNSKNFWLVQKIKYSKRYNFVNNSRLLMLKKNLTYVQKMITINKVFKNSL